MDRIVIMPYETPENIIGGDLVWWHSGPRLHTAVTLPWDVLGPFPGDRLDLHFVLHSAQGEPVFSWTDWYSPGRTLVVDSRAMAKMPEGEGVLAIFVSTPEPPTPAQQAAYWRLYSLVDWYSDDGEFVALHNDHSLTHDPAGLHEFTEIVVLETPEDRNSLLMVNGYLALEPGSMQLSIRNHRGETRDFKVDRGAAPFTVFEIDLREHVPDLVDFVEGRHANIEGALTTPWMFLRPYVLTRGSRMSGYHGGDRYTWDPATQDYYDAQGRGEVNPMAVLRRSGVRTFANVFNSHNDVRGDWLVDARLYDSDGTLVASRDGWLVAPAAGSSRGALDDLIPGDGDFFGYLALTFAPDERRRYPGRLQLLMEYRTEVNTSRVMAWSDNWSTPDRLAAGAPRIAGYRVWLRGPIRTHLAISNVGPRPAKDGVGEYAYEATYRVTLRSTDGRSETWTGSLPPHASALFAIDEIFPEAKTLLGEAGIGWVSVQSTADLALVQFTHHEDSGVWSAEHFMGSEVVHEGVREQAAGM